MQDLLNEEEFIEKKTDYNPWRRFGVFYGISSAIILTYFIYTEVTSDIVTDAILVGIIWANPILMSFVMVFSKKSIYNLPFKAILIGIEGLMAACYITLLFVAIIDVKTEMFTLVNLKVSFYILAVFMGLGLLCFALMYPILRYRRKRLIKQLVKQRS